MSHQFKATVWIHQNSQTGQPVHVELTSISGENIDTDFLRYMMSHEDDRYVLERFSGLKAETPYNIIGHYWWCDKTYDLRIDAYVEILIDKGEVDRIVDDAIDYARAMAQSVPF